jgi:glucuronosyltransferase
MRLHQEGRHPMDETVWLLEFLSKTGGAEHLRLESRNLDFVQYHCLDVAVFLLVVSYLVFRLLKKACCGGNRKSKLD